MKRLLIELKKGKEFATQLKTLMDNDPGKDRGLVLGDELAFKILGSFDEAIDMVSSCIESTEISGVDHGGSACSGEMKKKPAIKDRRGCYKRKKASESWTTVSPTTEDGFAWRKYGQKNILLSENPRCYFRCTHKYEGCKATKQVQNISNDPFLYKTTYFNHHTCTHTMLAPQTLIVDSDPEESNLLSFKTNSTSLIKHEQDNSPDPIIISSAKQKYSQSDHDLAYAKSPIDPSWLPEIIGPDSFSWYPGMNSYEEEGVSGFCSSSSTSLQYGLDMEVNQLGDIHNLEYFDEL